MARQRSIQRGSQGEARRDQGEARRGQGELRGQEELILVEFSRSQLAKI